MRLRNALTLFLLFIFQISLLSAQEKPLQVSYKINNPESVNNGEIILEVEGGKAPYKYYWSKQEVDTLSNKATQLVEGLTEKVRVEDSEGNVVEKEIQIPANNFVESTNAVVTRVVKELKNVLFYDVLAGVGLYDNTVYADQKMVPIPNWSPSLEGRFKLKEWYVPEGEVVKKGQKIARITRPDGTEEDVFATKVGELVHLANEGGVIYSSFNKSHVIEEGAHNLAGIKYQNPRPVKYPNGTIMHNNFPFVVLWLLIGALFFTLRMGFVNIRGFRHSINLARGKYDEDDAPGQVTHFQALATAVSGTVGLGNIAGVAVAISMGGAGATFWMIVAGFLAMSTKFVECSLGVKYRDIRPDGRIFGGPMNYLRYGLEKKNLGLLGKILAMVFAVTFIIGSFGIGNMFQVNQAFEQISSQYSFFQGKELYFGIFSALLVGFVIIGGIKSIAKVTEKIVPFMSVFYIIGAIIVIAVNIQNIDLALKAIWDGAFSPASLKGGVFGVLIVGLQRAAFSNEAGLGSAAIAHSAAKTKRPVSEGFVALLEPFIDTIIICSMTALVLIFTGMHEVEGIAGAQLTSRAFGSVVSWFPSVLAVAVFLFAFSTMITWSYYGMRAWTYVFGRSKKMELLYKIIFLSFIVLGSTISLGVVLDLSDMLVLAMAFPNILGLYILSGEVKMDLNQYWDDLKHNRLFKKSGTK